MQSITVDEAFIKLSSQGWLADVDAEQQDLLKSIASIRCVAAEQRIFEIEGDPLAVVGIVSGSVRLSMVRPTGDEYTLFRPGPGFWVGHYAVLNDAPHLLACTAAEPTVVVWLPKRRLLQLVNTELNLYKAFSKLTYRHMGNVLDLVAGMTLQDSDQASCKPAACRRLGSKVIRRLDTALSIRIRRNALNVFANSTARHEQVGIETACRDWLPPCQTARQGRSHRVHECRQLSDPSQWLTLQILALLAWQVDVSSLAMRAPVAGTGHQKAPVLSPGRLP